MSRIGLKPVIIPEGVKIEDEKGVLKITGAKGSLEVKIPEHIAYEIKDGHIHFTRNNEEKQTKQNHGTVRANVHNAIIGVSQGYVKNLEIVGIGYRASMRGNNLVLNVGYSHEIVVTPEPGVKIIVPDPLKITVEGVSRQAVGQTAAVIREARRPEPYQGKGIHYKGEHIIRKEGKRAAATAKK